MIKRGILLLTVALLSSCGYGQDRMYSKQDILEDLFVLRTQLEEKHATISIYTTPKAFNSFFDNIEIADSLSELEAYHAIASSHAIIQDGHTIMHPNQKFVKRNDELGYFFPVEPYWHGERLFVYKNHSGSNQLKPGDEILSINGLKSQDIMRDMISKLMRDGNNFNYPIWLLNTYFFEFYSHFYGCSEGYELLINVDGEAKAINIAGIKKSELMPKVMATRDVGEKGISLDVDLELSTAILVIKDWHKSKLRQKYKQKFMPVIKDIIKKIETNNVENLIIDLRDNQGGEPEYSKFLLSYLMPKPFVLVEAYNKIKNGKLVSTKGPEMGTHKPMRNTFSGAVYVLTNGGSFSNSSIFSSVLKKYNRAVFVGQETGGSEFVICGNTKTITLPNTKTQIEVPRLQFLIKQNGDGDYHGIRPDHEVVPSIHDLIDKKDVVLDYTIDLIKANSNQQ